MGAWLRGYASQGVAGVKLRRCGWVERGHGADLHYHIYGVMGPVQAGLRGVMHGCYVSGSLGLKEAARVGREG